MRVPWALTWAVPIAAQVAVALWFADSFRLDSAEVLFFGVTIMAALCVVASTGIIARAFRTNDAELAAVGTFFYAVSVLPLVHGVTTPGVLFDDNSATSVSVLVAVPVGLLAIAPFLAPSFESSRSLRRHWQVWIAAAIAAVTFLAPGLLALPNLVPAVELRSPVALTVAVVSVVGCLALSHRHLVLARIAHRRSPLAVSFGLGLVAASSLVWLAAEAYDAGFWFAHFLDVAGVLIATAAAAVVYQRNATMEQVLGPVLVTEPLSALAVGMDPIVHRFVAELDEKDPITRDHVIRTTELAVRVGQEMRLGATQLRDLGLAAILHDLGKVGVPDEILNKPGRLTPDEFAQMREHAVLGEQMVSASPVLSSIAPAVRGHHERMDGGGYPDGLVGQAIPQNARIVAVCDAYDAMANSRQYRVGMGHDKAVAILREHSGSQWDAVAVEALVMTLARRPMTEELHIQIDQIGRDITASEQTAGDLGCDCLPEAARAHLEHTI